MYNDFLAVRLVEEVVCQLERWTVIRINIDCSGAHIACVQHFSCCEVSGGGCLSTRKKVDCY